MVVVISYGPLVGCCYLLDSWSLPKRPFRATCVGTRGMCMPRALTVTPSKMAPDLQIPRHDLAHFCCAPFCRSECSPRPPVPFHVLNPWCSSTTSNTTPTQTTMPPTHPRDGHCAEGRWFGLKPAWVPTPQSRTMQICERGLHGPNLKETARSIPMTTSRGTYPDVQPAVMRRRLLQTVGMRSDRSLKGRAGGL